MVIVVQEYRNTWILPWPPKPPLPCMRNNDEWTRAWLVQSYCLKLYYKALLRILGWNAYNCPKFRSLCVFLSPDPHLRTLAPSIRGISHSVTDEQRDEEHCSREEAKRQSQPCPCGTLVRISDHACWPMWPNLCPETDPVSLPVPPPGKEIS